MTQALFTFASAHVAMEAELDCEEAGLPCRLIPLPASLSAGCGLALLCPQETQAAAFRLMARGRIPVEAVYLGDKNSWRRESA